MKTEQTALAKIINEWKKLRKNISNKASVFFKNKNEFPIIDGLFNGLESKQPMNIAELIQALQVIESFIIKEDSLPTKIHHTKEILVKEPLSTIPFAKWLNKNNYRTLQDFAIESEEKPQSKSSKFSISETSNLCGFLIKTHDILLNHYELANAHAHGEIPVSEINYSQSQLQESQAFYDMEITSQQDEAPDKATIVADLKRGVTLYGLKLFPNNMREQELIQVIEDLAGDKIATPHSKASKIYNFGGQFLEGCLANEFTNTVMLPEEQLYGLEIGLVKGHTDWSLEPDTYNLYATVNLKLLTCGYAPENPQEPQKNFAMGSDGVSLIELNNEELEKVMKQCRQEMLGETENNIIPICEMTAKIKVTKNEKCTGYMLKVDQFTTKFNTKELVFSKALEPTMGMDL